MVQYSELIVQEYGLYKLMTIYEFRRGITVFLVVGNPAAPISTYLRALF
jgi:hypothetical protein